MIINQLQDLHQSFSDYINEDTPPAVTDVLYMRRTRWFNRAREDIAKRWFFPSLANNTTLPITAGLATYVMFADFNRPNALRTLQTADGTTVYTDPFNTITSTNSPVPLNGIQYSGTTLWITRILSGANAGLYQLQFNPAPNTTQNLTMIYYATPPLLVNPTDVVLLDGDAVIFFALTAYHMSLGNYTDMAEFRQEYENRVAEIIQNESINTAGSLTGMANYEQARHADNDHDFYSGNTRKNYL